MSLDWENQYFQNDYTAQDNLKIQCNSYEIINDFFFCQSRTKSLKIHIKTQKTPNSQSNPEKETLIHEELEESSSLTSYYTIKLQ